MSFFRALLGRSKPAKPDLDQLFGLPSAAITLQATAGFRPTGTGSVAFRPAEGQAFASLEQDITALLNADNGPEVEPTRDEYGYTWLVLRSPSADAADISGLVTEIHAANTSLEHAGFGPSLLCSLVTFADEDGGRRFALVYLYKRGTFYPFAPIGGKRRDNALELQIEAAIANDLPVEKDKSRWFPVYGAPGI
ncbi:hypothetical protein F4561_001628 [Lipingzhangella halophila]|uniref:Uncharacterized protein n=1 Tax=Lipingzhangella halophila TaxID=1783352 RepID=A0A7W7W1Y6_9ACTN|nr:hypothetical protein [Lipingzhangella halophila]MBB4930808.1 hypothetical protein [Lipingzhangella halophila]